MVLVLAARASSTSTAVAEYEYDRPRKVPHQNARARAPHCHPIARRVVIPPLVSQQDNKPPARQSAGCKPRELRGRKATDDAARNPANAYATLPSPRCAPFVIPVVKKPPSHPWFRSDSKPHSPKNNPAWHGGFRSERERKREHSTHVRCPCFLGDNRARSRRGKPHKRAGQDQPTRAKPRSGYRLLSKRHSTWLNRVRMHIVSVWFNHP
jgi:hypothetical protein